MSSTQARDDVAPLPFTNLCHRCTPVLTTLESLKIFVSNGLRRELREIIESAEKGCSLCHVLIRTLEPVDALTGPGKQAKVVVTPARDWAPVKARFPRYPTDVFNVWEVSILDEQSRHGGWRKPKYILPGTPWCKGFPNQNPFKRKF